MFSKRLGVVLLPAVMFVVCIAPRARAEAVEAAKWYEYDKSTPLNGKEIKEVQAAGYKKIYFEFTDLQRETVPGVMTLPTGAKTVAPYPVIVMMHGFMMSKEDFINAAFQGYLAAMGYATVAIDFPMHGDRPGDPKTGFGSLDDAEKMFTQALFDVIRLLDYVETRPELDAKRIGYFGVSMGSIIGGIAAGVDERVKVMAFMIGGGGLECLFQGLDKAGSKTLGDVIKNDPDAIRRKLEYFDPVQYFQRLSPRPVLFYNVEDDPIVKKECAANFHNAVGEPKKVIWEKSGGHIVMPMRVKRDVTGWFKKYLPVE